MIALGIILLIVGAILLAIVIKINDENHRMITGVFLYISVLIGTIYIFGPLASDEAYYRSLKGKNPYKMEITYELKDSVYIPKDTIFVKIK